MKGEVQAIYICPAAGEGMNMVSEVRAVPGRGLEGDRYFNKMGYYSDKPGTGRELTLIESEALDHVAKHTGIRIGADQTRRNLVTSGISLNDLVGQEFQIGEITVRGVRLCDPCSYLEVKTEDGVLKAMVDRGGLRVDILTEGVIRVGDTVVWVANK